MANEINIGAPEGDAGVGKYHTRLRIGKYQRPKPFETPTFTNFKVVFLPLPTELRDDTAVGYTNINLETVGDIINGAPLSGAGAAALRYSGSLAQGVLGGLQRSVPTGGVAGQLAGGVVSAARALFPADQITSAVQQSFGVAPNPNPSVAFQGPILRDFSYSWALYPNSAAESRRIEKLIKLLKRSALPTNAMNNSAAILSYPDVCQINFFPWDSNGREETWGWSNNSIIRYKRCFMQTVNANYNPFGTPAFFEGTELPVSIMLTISFREIEYLLSSDWSDNLMSGTNEQYRDKSLTVSDVTGKATEIFDSRNDLAQALSIN